MYQVTVQTFNKKGKEMVDHITVSLGEMDEPGYDDAMHQLTDLLFGLDVDYDDVDGDGDIAVDDMLISASENEPFEMTLEGKTYLQNIRKRITTYVRCSRKAAPFLCCGKVFAKSEFVILGRPTRIASDIEINYNKENNRISLWLQTTF